MVVLDNMTEVLNFLNDIEKFFRNFDETYKSLASQLINKELERDMINL